jgi:hypothetical protein
MFTARGSAGAPSGVARNNATSNAWRCGAGSVRNTASGTTSTRSLSPAKDSALSGSPGRHVST